jgi:hypothetical protein
MERQSGGANSDLDDFLNNYKLQYVILQFFKFIDLNRAIFNQSTTPVAVQVNTNGLTRGTLSQRGGSIVETILNGPSHTTQFGGSNLDIMRIKSKLSEDVQLYSNGLRIELMQLNQQLKAINKELPAADQKALNNAIDKIAQDERAVLSATLAGHQFLEAHESYELNAEQANANATLEQLKKIATLLEGKRLKLKDKTQKVAQTMSLVIATLPNLRFTAVPRQ